MICVRIFFYIILPVLIILGIEKHMVKYIKVNTLRAHRSIYAFKFLTVIRYS